MNKYKTYKQLMDCAVDDVFNAVYEEFVLQIKRGQQLYTSIPNVDRETAHRVLEAVQDLGFPVRLVTTRSGCYALIKTAEDIQ